MTGELADVARKLLAAKPGEGAASNQIAERAARACEELAQHLARLIGDHGVRALLKRTLILTSVQHPWLADAVPDPEADGCALFRRALENQDPATAADAFGALLATFVDLLMRLIGEGLVRRLLHEVWPAIFPHAVKETT